MAKVLGDAMGIFVGVDNSHVKGFVGNPLRFKVRIDITQPLRRVIKILGQNNQEVMIRIAYERVPNFCYFYGVLGHLVKDCHECIDLLGTNGDVSDDHLMYGDWLRTHVDIQHSKYVNVSLQR